MVVVLAVVHITYIAIRGLSFGYLFGKALPSLESR